MAEKTVTAPPVKYKREDILSTGSTLLNLALSGTTYGGYPKGKYILICGDSTTGKTWFCLSATAEACQNKGFDDYRFIYDNVEDGALMDLETFFGEKAADRIEAPALDEDGEALYSETIEDFYYNVDDAVKEGKPFIYILDSMDALDSKDALKKFGKQKSAHRKGGKEAGSYGDGKAKFNSQNLRTLVNKVRASGSILMIIAQTRESMDQFSMDKKTRAGGKALRFYATAEFWLTLAGQFKKNIRKKNRAVGNKIQIKVKKNRITGKLPTITTAIYPSYGIDDIGSCIDFLIDEKEWKKKKGGKLTAGEFGEIMRSKLIKLVEGDPESMKKLRKAVLECWRSIDAETVLERKPRYS